MTTHYVRRPKRVGWGGHMFMSKDPRGWGWGGHLSHKGTQEGGVANPPPLVQKKLHFGSSREQQTQLYMPTD